MSLLAASLFVSVPAFAAQGASAARQQQVRGTRDIPRCSRNLGTVAIVEPDDQWWREFNLGSPETILRLFVQRSGCFSLVNRGRAMASRNMERALADAGELQPESNLGAGQVRAADYFLQPDIVTANQNSGGNNFGGVVGGLLGNRTIGAIAGGISVQRKEANVTLSLVNSRTTVEEALTEGYARRSDLGFRAGGGVGWWGGLVGAGAGGYQNTEIGQVIVLAYLDAFTSLVSQLGGLPEDAAAAAPPAR